MPLSRWISMGETGTIRCFSNIMDQSTLPNLYLPNARKHIYRMFLRGRKKLQRRRLETEPLILMLRTGS